MNIYLLITIAKLLFLIAIFAHAKENAITSKEKRISHTWEFIHILSLALGFYLCGIYGLWATAITYIALRIVLFGPIFGLLTTGDYARLSIKGYDYFMQYLLRIEVLSSVKFPAYTIWLAIWLFLGLFFDYSLVYLM